MANRVTQNDWNPAPETNLGRALERDTKLWKYTIRPLPGGDIVPGPISIYNAQTGFIRRLLLTLKFLEYRASPRDEWEEWPYPPCAALSHGGRVLINFPRRAGIEKVDKHWFWSWLLCGNEKLIDHGKWASSRNKLEERLGLKGRSFSTHGTGVGRDGLLVEKKGGGQNISRAFNPHTHQYGMNIALGGYGNKDAKGKPIWNDGLHGHLLVIYRTSERYNGILIGCENKEHGKKGKTHLGAGHSGRGRPQAISATGGLKWEDYHVQGLKFPGKSDCMRVVLDQFKFGELKDLERGFFFSGWQDGKQEMEALLARIKRDLVL